MSDNRAARSGCRAAQSSTISANKACGLASMREVRSIALSQLLAVDGFPRGRRPAADPSSLACSLTPALIAQNHMTALYRPTHSLKRAAAPKPRQMKNPPARSRTGPSDFPLRTEQDDSQMTNENFPTEYRIYFSDELIELNFVLRVEPRPLTAAIMARLMPAAIKPYSMAVAPDSSFQNFAKNFFTIPPEQKRLDTTDTRSQLSR